MAKVPMCFMCKEKPAKLLKAEIRMLDGRIYEYVNAVKYPVFCTKRCAANHALLWVEGEFTDSLTEHFGEEHCCP